MSDDEPAEAANPLFGDGRRATVVCPGCSASEHIRADVDTLDESVFLRCTDCERDILLGHILEAQITATTTVESLDALDPELRSLIQDHV